MHPSTISLLCIILATLLVVCATPLDVFVPPVLYPNHNTVWKVGERHNVTWDVSNPPKHITNNLGVVVLATNSLLDIDNPLAKGFNILLGHIEVTVPKVPAGNNYQIVVFGHSGNYGQMFTIVAK